MPAQTPVDHLWPERRLCLTLSNCPCARCLRNLGYSHSVAVWIFFTVSPTTRKQISTNETRYAKKNGLTDASTERWTDWQIDSQTHGRTQTLTDERISIGRRCNVSWEINVVCASNADAVLPSWIRTIWFHWKTSLKRTIDRFQMTAGDWLVGRLAPPNANAEKGVASEVDRMRWIQRLDERARRWLWYVSI